MTCKELESLLNEDIKMVQSMEVRDHIHYCEFCRKLCEELVSLDELSNLLRNVSQAPDGFMAQVCERTTQRTGLPMYWQHVAALCCILLGVVFLWPAVESSGKKELLVEAQVSEKRKLAKASDAVFSGSVVDDPETLSHVDLVVTPPRKPGDSPQQDFILRLPSRIEIHRTNLHDDFYLNHVSH